MNQDPGLCVLFLCFYAKWSRLCGITFTQAVINEKETNWISIMLKVSLVWISLCFDPCAVRSPSGLKNLVWFLQLVLIVRVSPLDAGSCRSLWPDPAQLFWPGEDGLHDGVCSRNGCWSHVWHFLLSQVTLNFVFFPLMKLENVYQADQLQSY